MVVYLRQSVEELSYIDFRSSHPARKEIESVDGNT
jgi:hypothetical protein